MATTWSGWQNQLLNRAGVIVTPPNRDFLAAWHQHAPGSCDNNPVDLSTAVAGSSRCGDTVAGFGRTQKYARHAQAAHAFALQLHTPWVKPLLDALNSGNPFQIGDRSQVVAVLRRWGSPAFADWYASSTTDSGGGGGGGGGTKAPRTHGGWKDLRRSVNHNLPVAVRRSHKLTGAALRSLSRVHKVR